jgi:hypothetical protein
LTVLGRRDHQSVDTLAKHKRHDRVASTTSK